MSTVISYGWIDSEMEFLSTSPSLSEDLSSSSSWSKDSWRRKLLYQAIEYPDCRELDQICALISRLAPLVLPSEIEGARKAISDVASGKAFIIQGGDCAESFDDLTTEYIAGQLDLLARQAKILSQAMGGREVIQIGRIAGQYAKPRSNPFEVLPSGEKIQAFRGHNVNSEDPKHRTPDPKRLLLGHIHAAATLSTMAEICGSRVAEEELFDDGHDCRYAGSIGVPGGAVYLHQRPLLSSHEALHLPLESAVTIGRYNTSASFLWIGERTRHLDSAHIEYVRGLRNPIGVKIGPSTSPSMLLALLDILCCDTSGKGRPREERDRHCVAIITRLGAEKATQVLAPLVRAVQQSPHDPIWMCDPCHGNTETVGVGGGRKTRRVTRIVQELEETYIVHRQLGSYLGGLHLEQSGQLVTECLDAGRVSQAADLLDEGRYTTLCDPRLAADQALYVIEQFVKIIETDQGDDKRSRSEI